MDPAAWRVSALPPAMRAPQRGHWISRRKLSRSKLQAADPRRPTVGPGASNERPPRAREPPQGHPSNLTFSPVHRARKFSAKGKRARQRRSSAGQSRNSGAR